jgi:hypothetical protein
MVQSQLVKKASTQSNIKSGVDNEYMEKNGSCGGREFNVRRSVERSQYCGAPLMAAGDKFEMTADSSARISDPVDSARYQGRQRCS